MKDRGQPTRSPTSPPDRSDFEALFRRYYGPLVGFFLNRGLARADGEDLAQETLMSAYRGYAGFRREASDSTWLFVIAANLWRNHTRDRRAQRRDGENVSYDDAPAVRREMEERAGAGVASPEDALLSNLVGDERRRLLWKAIPDLAPQMRRSLLLHLAELKYREIADILDVELGTVKSLVSQAKARLIQLLESERPDLFDRRR